MDLLSVIRRWHGRGKLDPYAEILGSWLMRESKLGRKRRGNLRQLHLDDVARTKARWGDSTEFF